MPSTKALTNHFPYASHNRLVNLPLLTPSRKPFSSQSTAGGQSQPIKTAPLGFTYDFSLKESPSHHHATEEGVRSPTRE